MFNFLDGIVSLIQSLGSFISSLVNGVFTLFNALTSSLAFVWSCVAALPSFLQVAVTILVSACVLRFILSLGRPE